MIHGVLTSAQFLSRDPAVATTRSPFGYVGGNPLNLIDPSGRYAAPPTDYYSCPPQPLGPPAPPAQQPTPSPTPSPPPSPEPGPAATPSHEPPWLHAQGCGDVVAGGAAMAGGGGILFWVGIALAPETGGASLIVSAVGGAGAVAGGYAAYVGVTQVCANGW